MNTHYKSHYRKKDLNAQKYAEKRSLELDKKIQQKVLMDLKENLNKLCMEKKGMKHRGFIICSEIKRIRKQIKENSKNLSSS